MTNAGGGGGAGQLDTYRERQTVIEILDTRLDVLYRRLRCMCWLISYKTDMSIFLLRYLSIQLCATTVTSEGQNELHD